jgi:hypothetical protein
MIPPFQGFVLLFTSVPKALPGAALFCAFSAGMRAFQTASGLSK